MAFTSEQKRQWRNKPEVQARQAEYKRKWNAENKQRRAQYMRDHRAGKVGRGSTTTPTQSTTTGDGGVFDGGSALCPWVLPTHPALLGWRRIAGSKFAKKKYLVPQQLRGSL